MSFVLLPIGAAMATPVTTAPTAPANVVDEKGADTGVEELDDLDLLNLDVPEVQVVVTAGRRVQKINTVPYAISVITADDIRQSGARNVPDALRQVAGIDVAELSYAFQGVSPRGLHGFLTNHTLVLIDGRQIFDSLFGITPWSFYTFQLEDIERIEVIRGPGGVTWGANAVNGVINIITKDPKDQLGLTVTGRAGSRGTNKEHLGYAFGDEKLRIRVSGEYESSDGFEKGTAIFPPFDDAFMKGRMELHAVYEPGPDDTVMVAGGSGLLDNGFPTGLVAGFCPPNAGVDHAYIMGKWTHRIADDNEFAFTGFVNDIAIKPGLPPVDFRYQQLALQFSHTFQPSEAHTITWGIDNRVDLFDPTNADPFMLSRAYVATDIVGLYLQDEWRLAPRWTLNLGGRIDYDSYGGFQPSGRAALSYEISETSMVYGAVSRAFHMPPAASRFLDVPLLGGIARMRGHEDLDPVTLLAYEVGYRATWFEKLETNVNLYWHEFADITTYHPCLGPPGLVTVDFDNAADASMYGIELDAKYHVSNQLTLLANYTFERMNWRSDHPFWERNAMSSPEHKFMTGVRYSPTDDIHLSSYLYYVDTVQAPNSLIPFFPKTIPEYYRLDLRAEYEFWKDHGSIAVGVSNLLDPDHPEGGTMFFGAGEVPRMVYGEVRLTFQ